MTPAHFEALYQSMMSYAQGRELFVQDLFGGADAVHRLPVRVVTEYAWHSLFIQHLADRADRGRAGRLRAGLHDRRSAGLPCRSGNPWLRQRHGDRREFRQEARAHRRHLLCRRDEEVGVHDPQLSLAAQARDADALLGQCRRRPRKRDLLRPVGHRQDDAVGRCQPHADRRRRAWLERERRLQFRRRLLRQGHQAVRRGRA